MSTIRTIKNTLLPICLILLGVGFSLNLKAQEYEIPLKNNHNLRSNNTKGFQRNFDNVCTDYMPPSLSIADFDYPSSCLQQTGSITVSVNNSSSSNFSYALSSPVSTAQASGATTATSHTFSGLRAGPYFITVTDIDEGINYEINYSLNDSIDIFSEGELIIPINGNNWEATKKDVFCSELGSIRRTFDTNLENVFILYDLNGTPLHNYSTDGVLAENLAIGTYYIEKRTAGSLCGSYYIIDIEKIITIDLPLLEDFSASWVYPDPAIWVDDLALINDTYAIDPPSIGTATLDGFNQFGNPYASVPESETTFIEGSADVLTSRPMCLADAGLEEGDSLLLSFFYQAEGRGDYPNPQDSLILEVWVPAINDSIFPVISFVDGFHIEYDDGSTTISVDVLENDVISFDETHIFFMDEEGNAIYLDFTATEETVGSVAETQIEVDNSFTVFYEDTTWVQVWAVPGLSESVTIPFQDVSIRLDSAKYFYNGFQFRFRNKATISGNNDHWHIDYVQAETIQPAIFPQLQDVAFVNPMPSMLNNYYEMPWRHFINDLDNQLAENVSLQVKNNQVGSANRNIEHAIKDVCSDFEFYNYEGGIADVLGNIEGTVTTQSAFIRADIKTAIEDISDLWAENDSVILENRWLLETTGGGTELSTSNDTIYQYQKFYNYFAYDDGTAERAYGLFGENAQLAYQFVLNQEDLLRAIQINFLSMNSNVATNNFYLKVWKSITPFTNEDSILYENNLSDLPAYLNEVNGFWTYEFEEPISISDTIYVGIRQLFESELNIGFDKNNNVSQKLFYNVDGQWLESIKEGALMLRPVVGGELPEEGLNVGISNPLDIVGPAQIKIYPNPVSNTLYIDVHTEQIHGGYMEVLDYTGRVVMATDLSQQQIDVSHIADGMYILRTFDIAKNITGTAKFIKY